MKIDGEFLAGQLRFTRWASDRLLSAARSLDQEELHRHLFSSYPSVHSTLHHIFCADRIWLSRLVGKPLVTLEQPGDEALRLDALEEAWHAVSRRFVSWASALRDQEVLANLDYVNLRGEGHSLPVWQVVLHVVNHGSFHRGQITTMLRQLGHTPPNTDLHSYYLQLQV